MTVQISGWMLMQMQIGAGKAGRGALPSRSHLEFAMHRLLASAGRGGFVGLGGRGSGSATSWVRAVRAGRFPMDHRGSSQEEEMALGRVLTLPSVAPVGAGGWHP